MEKITDKLQIAQSMTDLWNPLTDEQRQQFVEYLFVKSYEKDKPIYNEGDTPRNLAYLLEGNVKIYRDGIGGRQQIVRLIKPHTFFGYRSAFADEDHRTSAITNEPSQVAMLPLDFVKSLIKQNSQLSIVFLKQLSKALGIADNSTVNLTQKHIRGRLAEGLLRLVGNYGYAQDGQTINVSMSREDLASLSNMTTSNAIRTLSAFASEGIVTIEGKKIKVNSEEQLHRISRLG